VTDIDNYRRELFGEASFPMPQAYLATVKQLTAHAPDATPECRSQHHQSTYLLARRLHIGRAFLHRHIR